MRRLFLSRVTNRPVIDRTGLAGAFSIDITFEAQGLEGVPTAPASLGPRNDTPAVTAPSLFAVLQARHRPRRSSD